MRKVQMVVKCVNELAQGDMVILSRSIREVAKIKSVEKDADGAYISVSFAKGAFPSQCTHTYYKGEEVLVVGDATL